jgi:hypothetical protein
MQTTLVYKADTTLFDLESMCAAVLAGMGASIKSFTGAGRLLCILGPSEFGRLFMSEHSSFAHDAERSLRRLVSAVSAPNAPCALGATVSLEKLSQMGVPILLASVFSRSTLELLLERAGWRGRHLYRAVLSSSETRESIRSLMDAGSMPSLDNALWVCGSSVELIHTEDLGGTGRILVQNNNAATELDWIASPFLDETADQLFTVPTVALVPELLKRIAPRKSSDWFSITKHEQPSGYQRCVRRSA